MANRLPKLSSAKPKCSHGPLPNETRPSKVTWVYVEAERSHALPDEDVTGKIPALGAGVKVVPSHVPQLQAAALGR